MNPVSIKLTPERIKRLTRIAKETKSLSTRTANPRPSWRRLMDRIADGELVVVDCEAIEMIRSEIARIGIGQSARNLIGSAVYKAAAKLL